MLLSIYLYHFTLIVSSIRRIFSVKKQLYILDVQRRSLKDTSAGKAQRIDASHNGDKFSGQESQQHLLFFFLF